MHTPLVDMDEPASAQFVGRPLTQTPSEGYQRWVLVLLATVYAVNFIDRQIVSVLALDIKRDLGLSDADLGFLYGTAFGVFYALFGVPMGKLADSWNRVRMLTAGLALWSAMTALSGLSRTGGQLAAARVGVGIGEATASPCAYSLISDYFPRHKRATALAVYSSGMYIGAGLSLFIGAAVSQGWNRAYPNGWLGLVGWQASFLVVGIPGLLLAIVVATLREPVRGMSDGLNAPAAAHPFREFWSEVMTIVPPLTLLTAARLGMRTLIVNLIGLTIIAATAYALATATGDTMQWLAVGIGSYAIFSWAATLRQRDPPAFALTWETPAFVAVLLGFGLISFVNYAVIFWSLPYAESVLGADKATAGLVIGGGGAAGGFIGINIGGRLADSLRARNPSGRVMVILFAALAPLIPLAISFTTSSLAVFYALVLPMTILSSLGLAASAATSQDLVLPRMRGMATASYFLSITMLGLALGPYTVGRISEATGNLGLAVLSLVAVMPISAAALIMLYRWLPSAEASVLERARAAGEPA